MQALIDYPPKVFLVNWFRKDKEDKFLWPGFGENMRVLKWIVDRARLRVGGQETPFGWVPKAGDLDLSGLDIASERVDEATSIDLDEWRVELESQGEFFSTIPKLPRPLALQREMLVARIESMHGRWKAR
jgi:phosphoenolpyruvate carboxykinase (GTP)